MEFLRRRKKLSFDKNIAVSKRKLHLGDVPPFTNLEINICGVCNRKCFFCPKADRKLFPNKREFMSLEFYGALLKDLAGVSFKGRISFCGLSEPFIHKGLRELVEITKRYCPGCFLDILTNGDFSTVENTRELFEAGLDNMKVSMYDGPEQIPGFKKIQQECGLSDKQFTLRKRYLSAEEDFGMTINNRGGSVNLEQYNIVPLKEPLKRSCYYPFHKLIIDYDGDVMMCPFEKMMLYDRLERRKGRVIATYEPGIQREVAADEMFKLAFLNQMKYFIENFVYKENSSPEHIEQLEKVTHFCNTLGKSRSL